VSGGVCGGGVGGYPAGMTVDTQSRAPDARNRESRGGADCARRRSSIRNFEDSPFLCNCRNFRIGLD
jgi:hypothetical protein